MCRVAELGSLDLKVSSVKSLDCCPCCHLRIELRKDSGRFVCPGCGCGFRHNIRKWLIAIPVAVVVALALFYFAGSFIPPILIAFVVVPGIVFVILLRVPSYIITRPSDVTHEV